MGFFEQGGQTYDPNRPSSKPLAIETGWYQAKITESEIRKTQAGTGEVLKIRYDITGPKYQGRVVFSNISISNPNPQTVEIGRGQLNSLQGATGVHALRSAQDVKQFIGRAVSISVVRKEDQNYGDENGFKNEVRGWKAIEGSQLPQPSNEPAQPTQPAAGSGAPW